MDNSNFIELSYALDTFYFLYKIIHQPHFITLTVLHRIPVFTRLKRSIFYRFVSAKDYLGQQGLLEVCKQW